MLNVSSQSVSFIMGLTVAPACFILLIFTVSKLVAPRNPTPEKAEPYECGMIQAGQPLGRVRFRFTTLAILFVLFDAEAILLFAVAPVLKGSVSGLIQVAVFTAFPAFGLAYAWSKGALEWRA